MLWDYKARFSRKTPYSENQLTLLKKTPLFYKLTSKYDVI